MGIEDRYKKMLDGLEMDGNSRVLRQMPGGDIINLSSNDYLGVAGNMDWQSEFFEEGVRDCKNLMGASSSRLLIGTHSAHIQLETTLERMFQRPALTFSTGYQMNTGILPSLVDNQSLILADKLCHASLIDGLQLCRCRVLRYRHHDYEQLERLVGENHTKFREIVIVTESVFSMDGDVTPLGRLVELRHRYQNVMLYVDEAHAVGIYGNRGLGIADRGGVIGDIDLLCGTFGKALGSVGGYVVCSDVMRRYLINRCRTLIFTTALPPINALWTDFVLKKLERGKLRDNANVLLENSAFLRGALVEKSYSMPSASHIVPLIVGESMEAVRLSESLQSAGFYALPIRPPTVPECTSRLRFSLTSGTSRVELEKLINLL